MIEEHKHCVVCGKPTDPNKSICSPSCEELMGRQQRKMNRSRIIMLVLFTVMFLIILLSSYFFRS
ncbi:MAG: DUF2116 family Zn-ribbon domain-containing protein [Methanobacteriota archaeon]